ncbi:hypothetical protein CUMW_162070 [Citrus unshiu]|uniref:Uncharacterized protein n=1 Tax=Citrus unshiu TaxID=55188 RepID=A0A2H5PRZ4_CITUN|nr:hypothetical protein CUMW_162070 [Citrus unshiu]
MIYESLDNALYEKDEKFRATRLENPNHKIAKYNVYDFMSGVQIYEAIGGLPSAWVVKMKKKIPRIVQWKPMASLKINFAKHQPSINAPPSVTRQSDEYDDILSPTPEQRHETFEDEVPVDNHQEQTNIEDKKLWWDLSILCLNVQTRILRLDAHALFNMFILPDGQALDDYGVYTDVGNQNFSTLTSLYSFYGDVNVGRACRSSLKCLQALTRKERLALTSTVNHGQCD